MCKTPSLQNSTLRSKSTKKNEKERGVSSALENTATVDRCEEKDMYVVVSRSKYLKYKKCIKIKIQTDMKCGVTKKNGSAFINNGLTKVTCTVYACRSVERTKHVYTEKGLFTVTARFAPFSNVNSTKIREDPEIDN